MESVRRRRNTKVDERPLIIDGDPKAIASEAFRTLRTNLQFTSPDQELKTILVTSVGPGEGKSTVTANLAAAWAQSGVRVILVTCDLRRPVTHRIFGVRNSPGLTGYLSGKATLEEVIISTRVPGLDLIPGGPIPPNPAELLQSRAMESCVEELRDLYDVVLFDGPPAVAVTDAAIMGSQADGTILVVRANETPKDVALHAKDLLIKANANLLGVVLNRVNLENQTNYHYYYYYGEEMES